MSVQKPNVAHFGHWVFYCLGLGFSVELIFLRRRIFPGKPIFGKIHAPFHQRQVSPRISQYSKIPLSESSIILDGDLFLLALREAGHDNHRDLLVFQFNRRP